MPIHTEVSAAEAADRLAIRELLDAHAHCVDRRDADGEKALFTENCCFVVFMSGEGTEATYTLNGREALSSLIASMSRFVATTHFNGQSTIDLDGERAVGETYTVAHHLFTEDGERKVLTTYVRNLDTFTKIDGAWFFAERNVIVDWAETRPSVA